MYRVAIDTGGTFTDIAAVSESGQMMMLKSPTDRENPAQGIILALAEMAGCWGLDLATFLEQTDQIIHGTTLALNALLEGQGSRTALLTTEGFRDALEIRRSRRDNQWDLRAPVPRLLVPRRLRLGVRERLDYRGEVVIPLDREQLEDIIARLRAEGVESAAVCFLFSFQNPAHEQAAAEALREALPGVFITTSAEVSPRIREYERTSTVVLNAYLTPVLAAYLNILEEKLAAYGWHRPLYLMLNSGGLTDAGTVKNFAVKTLLSGPAGGAQGGQALAQELQKPDLVVADMGGTSFDVTLVVNGKCRQVPEAELAGHPVTLPMTDIRSIGAGGGSVASVDESGRLMVGPRSAGSVPGPACYGRGGTEPTVTDAALLLGLLNPEGFLGGRLRLDYDRAFAAVRDRVAVPLGLDIAEAALAIYRIAAARMADAIRLVTVQQGLDPRRFALVAAGGAFPLFAGLIAGELEMREAVIPLQGPVFCAWGMLGAARQLDLSRTCLISSDSFDLGTLNALVGDMLVQGNADLDRYGVSGAERETELTLEMKYLDQHHEISINPGELKFRLSSAEKINNAFHERHRELFGYDEPGKPWEIVNVRVVCREKARDYVYPGLSHLIGDNGEEQYYPAAGSRKVMVDPAGWQAVKVYGAADLPRVVSGSGLPSEAPGPALLEFPYTTVLVPAGFTASLGAQGYISLRRETNNLNNRETNNANKGEEGGQ